MSEEVKNRERSTSNTYKSSCGGNPAPITLGGLRPLGCAAILVTIDSITINPIVGVLVGMDERARRPDPPLAAASPPAVLLPPTPIVTQLPTDE